MLVVALFLSSVPIPNFILFYVISLDFEARNKFEQDWNKDTVKQQRIGLFNKPNSFFLNIVQSGWNITLANYQYIAHY